MFIKVTDVWVEKPRLLADGSIEMNVGTKEIWVNWDMVFTMNPVPFEVSHQWKSMQGHKLPESFVLDESEYDTLTRVGIKENEGWGHILETPEEIISMLEAKTTKESEPTKSKRGRPKGSKNKNTNTTTNTTDSKESKDN